MPTNSILSHWRIFLNILPMIINISKNWISLYTPLIIIEFHISEIWRSPLYILDMQLVFALNARRQPLSIYSLILYSFLLPSCRQFLYYVLYPSGIPHSRKSKILFVLLITIFSWYPGTERILLLLLTLQDSESSYCQIKIHQCWKIRNQKKCKFLLYSFNKNLPLKYHIFSLA